MTITAEAVRRDAVKVSRRRRGGITPPWLFAAPAAGRLRAGRALPEHRRRVVRRSPTGRASAIALVRRAWTNFARCSTTTRRSARCATRCCSPSRSSSCRTAIGLLLALGVNTGIKSPQRAARGLLRAGRGHPGDGRRSSGSTSTTPARTPGSTACSARSVWAPAAGLARQPAAGALVGRRRDRLAVRRLLDGDLPGRAAVRPGRAHEAAAIDGAGPVRASGHVTWPLLAPALTINLMLSIIGGIKLFDQVYALTSGGPGHATDTLSTADLQGRLHARRVRLQHRARAGPGDLRRGRRRSIQVSTSRSHGTTSRLMNRYRPPHASASRLVMIAAALVFLLPGLRPGQPGAARPGTDRDLAAVAARPRRPSATSSQAWQQARLGGALVNSMLVTASVSLIC